eukprot:CAMPEP_0179234140 /NCGR_PEP_ID=MMETSP0797-20121207/12737_1 /TAXON_ID=47934 /ORGANISM="Dinophysis acuminata, Strain DAEP01" /LENGTH=177 /DNA_ID=CAMNT_0020941313 /DNA_START=441 /DNA_END=970 /DNA_ORIENTATION=+
MPHQTCPSPSTGSFMSVGTGPSVKQEGLKELAVPAPSAVLRAGRVVQPVYEEQEADEPAYLRRDGEGGTQVRDAVHLYLVPSLVDKVLECDELSMSATLPSMQNVVTRNISMRLGTPSSPSSASLPPASWSDPFNRMVTTPISGSDSDPFNCKDESFMTVGPPPPATVTQGVGLQSG